MRELLIVRRAPHRGIMVLSQNRAYNKKRSLGLTQTRINTHRTKIRWHDTSTKSIRMQKNDWYTIN